MRTITDPDDNYWTASEAARILAPHLQPRQVRELIRAAGLTPHGHRHSTSFRGRKAATYQATDLIRLFGIIQEEFPAQEADA
jgi:hypothetical protein